MGLSRFRPASLLAPLVMAACGLSDVRLPSGEEQLVVQGVLNTQAAEQVLWIERTTPAGEVIEFGLRPLLEPPSRVEVRAEGGDVFTFLADTADPARFVATFTPVHGRRYDLLVEAEGVVLRATTVVPPGITIVAPAADTVSHPRDADFPVAWASGTSRHVAVYVTRDTIDVSRYVFPEWVRDDTTAVMRSFFFSPSMMHLVWVVAADSVTARLYAAPVDDGPRFHEGNVAGGAGLFGAITTDRVLVRVP